MTDQVEKKPSLSTPEKFTYLFPAGWWGLSFVLMVASAGLAVGVLQAEHLGPLAKGIFTTLLTGDAIVSSFVALHSEP